MTINITMWLLYYQHFVKYIYMCVCVYFIYNENIYDLIKETHIIGISNRYVEDCLLSKDLLNYL